MAPESDPIGTRDMHSTPPPIVEVGLAGHHLASRRINGLEARCAETVELFPRHVLVVVGIQQSRARDDRALLTDRRSAAEYDIVELAGIEFIAIAQVTEDLCGQVDRCHFVQRSVGPAAATRAPDVIVDVGVCHVCFLFIGAEGGPQVMLHCLVGFFEIECLRAHQPEIADARGVGDVFGGDAAASTSGRTCPSRLPASTQSTTSESWRRWMPIDVSWNSEPGLAAIRNAGSATLELPSASRKPTGTRYPAPRTLRRCRSCPRHRASGIRASCGRSLCRANRKGLPWSRTGRSRGRGCSRPSRRSLPASSSRCRARAPARSPRPAWRGPKWPFVRPGSKAGAPIGRPVLRYSRRGTSI